MAGPNPYLDLLEGVEEQRLRAQSIGIAASTALTFGTNPDEVARTRATAHFLEVPPAAVKANPAEAEQQARVRRIDADTAGAPVLRQRYTDADFMELAHDDSSVLASIETALGKLGRAAVDVGKYAVSAPGAPGGGMLSDVARAVRSLAAGAGPGLGAATYGGLAAVAGFSDEIAQGLDDAAAFLTGTPRRQIVGTPGLEGFFLDLQKRSTQVADAVEGRDPNAGFIERSVRAGFRSAGQNLAALPLGLAGGQGPMLGTMAIPSAGKAYGRSRNGGSKK